MVVGVSPKQERNEHIIALSGRIRHKKIAEMFGISPARVSQIIQSGQRRGPALVGRGVGDLLAKIEATNEMVESLLVEVAVSMRTLKELHRHLVDKIEANYEISDDEVRSLG